MKRIVVLWMLLSGGSQLAAQQLYVASRDTAFIKQLFFSGLRDKLNDNYERGILSFKKIVSIDTTNAPAYYELALLSYRTDNLPEAEIAIKKAVAIDQHNVWYWKLLAELYKRNGNMTALIPVFNKLITLAPQQQDYYYDRSNALLLLGKKDEAMKGYILIEKLFGPSEALNEAKERAGGVSSSTVSANEADSSDPIAVAKAAIAVNDFNTAVNALRNAVDAHIDDPLFLALYGDVLFETGDLPSCLIYYKKALNLTDQLYGVWEKVLSVHLLLGQYNEMIQVGNSALSVYPNQAILYYYMAFALHREMQNEKALAHIKTALQLDGDSKSLQALILALQAEILIDENKLPAADAAFEKAVSLDLQNYLIINNYAYYLALRNGNLAKAESLISKAANAMPADASIADTYAFVLFKLEKYAEARVWIEKALKNKEANNGVYLEHYGDILYAIGEQEQALLQWQKSKKAGNGSPLLNRKINEKKYIK